MLQAEFDMIGQRLRPHPTCWPISELFIGLGNPSDENIHITNLGAVGANGVLLGSVSQDHWIDVEVLGAPSPTHASHQRRLDGSDVLLSQLDVSAPLLFSPDAGRQGYPNNVG